MRTGNKVKITPAHRADLARMGFARKRDSETGTIRAIIHGSSHTWAQVDFPSQRGAHLSIQNLERA